jgi:hypothetical protein
MVAIVLRWLAVVIAIAGVIDPAIPGARRARPEIAVVAVNQGADADLASRVARELGSAFTVVPGAYAGAAATVVVGERIPAGGEYLAGPVFAVRPARTAATVELEAIDAPGVAPLDARSRVTVAARVAGASGRVLDVSLRAGEVTLVHVTQTVTGADSVHRVALPFAPFAPGPQPLTVHAVIRETSAQAAADVLIDVAPGRRNVLFFARRPSWMMAFVQRVVEGDPQFAVTSRVIASRSVSVAAGSAPPQLDNPVLLDAFDVIVVGAPDALTAREAATLDAYARRRGGSVVLLFDRYEDGAHAAITGAREWSTQIAAAPASIELTDDTATLRAASLAWPRELPAGAVVMGTSDSRPIIWESAVGAGRIVVSGALDSWRYREATASGFEVMWRSTLSTLATASVPIVEAKLSESVIQPLSQADITVTLRGAALAGLVRGTARASAAARVEADSTVSSAVLLYPTATPGVLRGRLRAPASPGAYRVVVTTDEGTVSVPLAVARTAAGVAGESRAAFAAWIQARGGLVIPEAGLNTLSAAVAGAVPVAEQRTTRYPMRSAWWIIPFALALGAEWYARRRRGDA